MLASCHLAPEKQPGEFHPVPSRAEQSWLGWGRAGQGKGQFPGLEQAVPTALLWPPPQPGAHLALGFCMLALGLTQLRLQPFVLGSEVLQLLLQP